MQDELSGGGSSWTRGLCVGAAPAAVCIVNCGDCFFRGAGEDGCEAHEGLAVV